VRVRNALVSRSGSSKQSSKLFLDLLQPLMPSFMKQLFWQIGFATSEVSIIARGNLSDLALQLFDAFDRQLAHNLIIRPEAPTAL
jgi:hypothetical protein